MADYKELKDVGEVGSDSTAVTGTPTEEKKRGGVISRIWNGIFRLHDDDFEKRLQHIAKEESAILARMKKRSLGWGRLTRNIIVISVLFEVTAVGYAIMTTRSLYLDWKMRALRVLPMFLLPGLSFLIYSSLVSLNKMWDRKDQKALERLRAEKKAKIDELKEKTNYYTTQQLIQRYDPDPAAKAAAASVLASKLGADSGLTVYMEETSSKLRNNMTGGKSNNVEFVQSTGLRKRGGQQLLARSTSIDSALLGNNSDAGEMLLNYPGSEEAERISKEQNQHMVVEHHSHPSGSTANDGGWIARIAALLVGEDPTQCYALICGNCHMHNGLARNEDFPYITYYCPHCKALNRPKQKREESGLYPGPLNPEMSSSSAVDDANLHKDVTTSQFEKAPISTNTPATIAEGETEECEGNGPESIVS